MIKQANQIMGQIPRLDPVFKADGGIWIDIPRYLTGEPESWGDMLDLGAERRSRKVAIVFNAGANCYVDTEAYERVAQTVGALVLGFRASGVPLSLYVCYKNSMHQDTDITAINMTAGGMFNIAHLAALTRTWFFRRLVFSWWETREKEFRDKHEIVIGGGYGRSSPMAQQEAVQLSGIPNTVLLNLSELVTETPPMIRDRIMTVFKETEKCKT
jgi:hypothetical protein